jgi:hypothetical protein
MSTLLGDVTPNWEEKILGGNEGGGGLIQEQVIMRSISRS